VNATVQGKVGIVSERGDYKTGRDKVIRRERAGLVAATGWEMGRRGATVDDGKRRGGLATAAELDRGPPGGGL